MQKVIQSIVVSLGPFGNCTIDFRESTGVQGAGSRFDMEVAALFDDHYCTVWRVSWNVTGTTLASSGDDGCVRLWEGGHSLAVELLSFLHIIMITYVCSQLQKSPLEVHCCSQR